MSAANPARAAAQSSLGADAESMLASRSHLERHRGLEMKSRLRATAFAAFLEGLRAAEERRRADDLAAEAADNAASEAARAEAGRKQGAEMDQVLTPLAETFLKSYDAQVAAKILDAFKGFDARAEAEQARSLSIERFARPFAVAMAVLDTLGDRGAWIRDHGARAAIGGVMNEIRDAWTKNRPVHAHYARGLCQKIVEALAEHARAARWPDEVLAETISAPLVQSDMSRALDGFDRRAAATAEPVSLTAADRARRQAEDERREREEFAAAMNTPR